MSSAAGASIGKNVSPSGRIRRSRPPSFIDSIHRRVRVAFFLLALFFLVLFGELVQLQFHLNQYFLSRADKIRVHTISIPAQRGRILDCNGAPLAVDIQVADIVADPTQMADANAAASALSSFFSGVHPGVPNAHLDPTDLALKIAQAKSTLLPDKKPLRYLLILPDISYAEAQELKNEIKREAKLNLATGVVSPLNGVSLLYREARSYPNGDLASQVLGFVNRGPVGTPQATQLAGHLGIEGKMNGILTGTDGSITDEQDAGGHVISYTSGTMTPAVSGTDVMLTIDSTIQRIAQNELEKSCAKWKAKVGTVIVVDPSNGDILALANNPTFDPNHPSKYTPQNWNDPAVSNLYEPGSTMKALTLSAVLDTRGLDAMNDHIFCSGKLRIGNRTIHCADDPPTYGKHGDEDMRQVLENSCNIGAYLFAKTIGAQKLYQYEGRFGILDKPDSGLPDERYCGLVSPAVKRWPDIELANIAFGQGISLSPLQVASIYSTIANNGVVVHPHILMGNGYTGPPQAAVKPEVAQAMLSMLQSVVQKGTGETAQLEDYTIGGKTGSAQVFEDGRYGDHYVGSFVGIAPLTHPRLVVLCAIFDPKGMHWGAVVAAPVVRNIMEQSLHYLRIPSDKPSAQPDSITAVPPALATHPGNQGAGA